MFLLSLFYFADVLVQLLSCVGLCDAMNCSTLGFRALPYLSELLCSGETSGK